MTVSQVHHYDDRKRPDTGVYDVVSDRKRYTHDRKRAVNDSVGFRSITVVSRRVVYDEIRMSFTPETCRKTVVFPTNTTVYATFTTASRRNSPQNTTYPRHKKLQQLS